MKTKRGYGVDLEKETKKNNYFRRVLYTAKHSQLVLMSLKPKEEIGAVKEVLKETGQAGPLTKEQKAEEIRKMMKKYKPKSD